MNERPSREKRNYPLTEPDLERIAQRAAYLVMEQMYAEIGKSIVRRAFVVVGIGVAALTGWLYSKGYLSK